MRTGIKKVAIGLIIRAACAIFGDSHVTDNMVINMVTLEVAQQQLDAWLAANLALASAQSYQISTPSGSRSITRADSAEVLRQIEYWQNHVEALSSKARRPRFSRVNFNTHE